MTTTHEPPTTEHAREAVCPSYCAGHSETYQPWEDADPGLFRCHSSNALSEPIRSTLAHPMFLTKGSASVEVSQIETTDAMTSSVVSLVLGEDSLDITPTQARAYAETVRRAADVAEGVDFIPDLERNAFEIGKDYGRSLEDADTLRLEKPEAMDPDTWAALKAQVRAFVGDRMEEL